MAIENGMRVRTLIAKPWKDPRYAGERGWVIGWDVYWHVVMDDPSLHDRRYNGIECCAFQPDHLMSDEYLIEEMAGP